MAIIENVNETLHRIRVKLYPNYLPNTPGKYIARADDEASLTVEQICAAAKNRGGYTGNYEDLVEHVKIYFNEAAYQLADGYSVNTGWFSIHPRVGGTFDSVPGADTRAHRVDFSFRVRSPLRSLASKIEIFVEGIADIQGYINEVVDVHTGLVDDALTPNGMIAISGNKIKVEGANPDVGVYFVQRSTNQAVKVSERLADNSASRIIASIPPLASGVYYLRIVTQYTRGGSPLKEPRVIEYARDLSVA